MESTGVRQKGLRRWRMESKGDQAREEQEDGGRRRNASGKEGRDKVGWLGRVMEEDQKKLMVWACARQ